MDRLVSIDVQEVQLIFKPHQRCTATIQLTNLMHTMSVAVSLTTTNPSLFTFSHPYSILPPLSSSLFSLHLFQPSLHPPLSYPSDSLLIRTSMLPTGKATQDDLRRLFSTPGPGIFKDATLPITFVGDHVVEFLFCPALPRRLKTLEITFLFSKAVSVCTQSQINNLLLIAVISGNSSFVSALIEAGGDVNSRDSTGKSMLSFPVISGNSDVARTLIGSGCQVNDSIDMFLRATELNRVDVMEILCENENSVELVNSVDALGRTPVHVSAFNGHVEALRFCVSMNGDPDCVDYDGWTPFHCAAAEGHIEVVEFLLEFCLYSKHTINKDGKTPFSLAVENGHESPHLLDVLHLNDVLQRMARLGDVNAINSCIVQGANVNGRDQNGWTPLHRAAFKGQIESVKALLSHGAQIDLVDDLGYTPLHCAVEAGHAQVALHLIAHGAQGCLKSIQDLSPIDLDCCKIYPTSVSPMQNKMEKA